MDKTSEQDSSEYKGETCEGCAWLVRDASGNINCYKTDMLLKEHANIQVIAQRRCDEFILSLHCRDVRAAERTAAALESIAAQMNPHGMIQVPVVDFGDGRCMQCNGTGTVREGTTGEGACFDCKGSGRIG